MSSSDATRILREQLQATLGALVELEGELSGGGMSRVFVANEAHLGRRVVVKVLAPELAAGISADRFEREIRIIASLQQANIVPLIATGHAGGLPFYTMPFVEGLSLRDHLRTHGALPIGDALSVLRDIARALAYAHERGVVHRDIKPGNVLLSGGAAVVTDFGIAKALSASRTGDADGALTGTGSSVGTPAYMSPEQAAGDPNVDHRADIYAFGCVAYELFAGVPPFHGKSLPQIVASHFNEVPDPVTKMRADVPRHVTRLISQCLEKEPSRRPQTGGDLLRALDATTLDSPEPWRRHPRAVSVGLAIAAVLMIAAGAYAVWHARARGAEPKSGILLAVLPFVNVGGDSAQEYLADGIGDELTTALGKVPGVQITGRTAAQRYRGRRDADIREVGRALGARYVVEGTLRQSNGRLSVSVQLADATSGEERWADSFEKNTQDLAVVKDSIVTAIRARLGVAPAGSRVARAERPVNPDAYALYLLGEYLTQRRGADVSRAVEKFEQAIRLDPQYARAYAGLAQTLELLPYFTGIPLADVSARAMAAAQHAIALDSTLADAHSALAQLYAHGMLWAQAEQEFRLALRLEPDDAPAHVLCGRFYLHIGRPADALAEFQRAEEIDRTSGVAASWQAYALFRTGKLDAALTESRRALQLDSTLLPAFNMGSLLNVVARKPDVARRIVDGLPTGNAEMSYAPYVYAMVGDTAKAMRMLRALDAREPRPWFSDVDRATVMLALGDTAAALTALERSEERSGQLWTLFLPYVGDPAFDPVRGSARFEALVAHAGLDTRSRAVTPVDQPR